MYLKAIQIEFEGKFTIAWVWLKSLVIGSRWLKECNILIAIDITFSSGDPAFPYYIFIRLFFALFGLTNERDVQVTQHPTKYVEYVFQIVFAIYMLMTTIILINLLIAMMSDTYQRIQQQSDMEWKFGYSKLITDMSKTDMAPAPINLFTSWITYFAKACKKGE